MCKWGLTFYQHPSSFWIIYGWHLGPRIYLSLTPLMNTYSQHTFFLLHHSSHIKESKICFKEWHQMNGSIKIPMVSTLEFSTLWTSVTQQKILCRAHKHAWEIYETSKCGQVGMNEEARREKSWDEPWSHAVGSSKQDQLGQGRNWVVTESPLSRKKQRFIGYSWIS